MVGPVALPAVPRVVVAVGKPDEKPAGRDLLAAPVVEGDAGRGDKRAAGREARTLLLDCLSMTFEKQKKICNYTFFNLLS